MTMGKVGKERLKAVERNSFGPDLGEISLCVCVCGKVWRFRPQVCQERGHNSQWSYAVQLTSHTTGIMSSALYINLPTASRFQPFLRKTSKCT